MVSSRISIWLADYFRVVSCAFAAAAPAASNAGMSAMASVRAFMQRLTGFADAL
jgi:hypothetical protein